MSDEADHPPQDPLRSTESEREQLRERLSERERLLCEMQSQLEGCREAVGAARREAQQATASRDALAARSREPSLPFDLESVALPCFPYATHKPHASPPPKKKKLL